MTLAMSSGGVLEILLGQVVGKMCDKYGRRPAFLVNSGAMVLMSLLTFFHSKNVYVVVLNRMLVWSFGAIFGGLAHSSAALSDLLEGDELGQAFSRLFSHIGGGVLVGLTFGSTIMYLTQDPKYCMLARSIAGLIAFYIDSQCLEETLRPEDRCNKPITLADTNPLKCLALFSHGKTLSTLVLCAVLQNCAEGKHTADVRALWVANELQFSLAWQSIFMNYWSLLATYSGTVGSMMMATLGRRGFTTAANALTALGFYLVSLPEPWAVWVGNFIMCPAFNTNHANAIKSYATDHATKLHGMGRGEYAAAFANLRGLSVVLAPPIYARLYGSAQAKGVPGRSPWLLVALIGAVIPELLHRSLSDEEVEAATPASKGEG